MKLYPYQTKAVRDIKRLLSKGRSPLCYAPTAAGKTEIAGAVMAQVKFGPKLFIVHTDQLREQASSRLEQYGVDVVTIQTLLLAPDLYRDAKVVCFDECHHLQGQSWREAVAIFSDDCAIFGLSATPFAGMLSELFDELLIATTVQSLVREGYIVPVSIMRRSDAFVEEMEDGQRIDGALAYNKHFRGRQGIHFEPEIALCERVAEQYKSLGISHAVISGKTPAAQRSTQIMNFRERRLQVLISPVLLSEGFDAPCAEIVIAGRAFNSDVLLQQAVGRVRRRYEGKTEAWLLDCTGCCDGKTPNYFNSTDEDLFVSLDGPGETERTGTPKRRPRTGNIVWVECNLWDVQSPDMAEILQRQEFADILQAARQATSERKAKVDEVKKKKEVQRGRTRRADPEVRAKMLERDRARRADPQVRAKMVESDRSRKARPGAKEKRVEYDRARREDPEFKAKMVEYNKAKNASPEMKARQAERNRVRRTDPEVKAKRAAQQSAYRASPEGQAWAAQHLSYRRERARALRAAKKAAAAKE